MDIFSKTIVLETMSLNSEKIIFFAVFYFKNRIKNYFTKWYVLDII
ncbi:hypothetical protein HMPREF0083_04678 [Aneurinibacillus aneurinilyticus ATCC 12856]|uniref:Uncharacterized protein n=1 Tax=Aneurinibacillus aneurinilyticus ATCC 12856 TaxID=649747 RepID=U1Y4X2_ANEAE|nr:hypothetical protein HMPREF0083_04678 [Aneurinibacillus aneurinilyticus ATCC 12856]